MNHTNKQEMANLALQQGIPISSVEKELEILELNKIKFVDLLPEMFVMVRSVVAKKTISYLRKPIEIIDKGLLISFQNIINNSSFDQRLLFHEQPHVRITPLHLESEVAFPANINIRQVTILISLDYLKKFIGKEQNEFDYLFNDEKTLWIEEFMSPEIANVVNEMSNNTSSIVLPNAFYKLKTLELLYYLFKNLTSRQDMAHHNLNRFEIESVYRVRDKIALSLDKPFIQEELIKISGMNVLKLRNLFLQVFGKGMYPYYQLLRMQEAARLIKEEHLSVSEAGYHLGFSNLSYFGRLFERHFGMKPKKWSQNKQ